MTANRAWQELYSEQSPATQRYMHAFENRLIYTEVFSEPAVREAYNNTKDSEGMTQYATALFRRADNDALLAYAASADKASLDAFAQIFRTTVAKKGGYQLPVLTQIISR